MPPCLPLACAVIAATSCSDPPPIPAVEDLLTAAGFGPGEIVAIRAGGTRTEPRDPSQDAELAVAAATSIAAPVETVVEVLLSTALGARDPGLIQVTRLEEVPEDWLAPLGATEADALLEYDDGAAFNLSSIERNRLRGVSRRGGELRVLRDRVIEVYTESVRGRAHAYARRGLTGVAPYRRDDDEIVDPAALLRQAIGAEPVLRRFAPELAQANANAGTVARDVLVVMRTVEERPCAIVAERRVSARPGFAAILERHVYVGHSYDAMQLVTVCVTDAESRTVIIVLNRTSVSRVDAIGRSVRRRVGRGRLSDEVEAHLDRLRSAVQDSVAARHDRG